MKEFNFMLREPFTKGLRPNSRMPKNNGYLTKATNVLSRPERMLGYTSVTQPIPAAELTAESITIDFPFPQLFKMKDITLLLGETSIWTVDESTWLLTPVAVEDYSTGVPSSIVAGGPWHVADFWEYFSLFNGSTMIMKRWSGGNWLVQDNVTITTGTSHRGRMVYGGFDTSDFWSSAWKTNWQGYILSENPPNAQIIKTMTDIGTNWIHWSSIGGGDAEFIFNITRGTTGLYTGMPSGHTGASEPIVLDYALRNEWGFMPMTFQGQVINIKSLGKHLVVYGTDGINVLTQYSDPTPTYGLSKEIHFGLESRSAVTGDDRAHYFMDPGGHLWRLTADLDLKKMDYFEYLSPLIGSEIIATTNAHEGIHTFSDEVNAYSFVEGGGLTKTEDLITSQFYDAGSGASGFGQVGIVEKDRSQNQIEIVTDIFDMDIRGQKTIVGIEFGGRPTAGMFFAIEYKNDGGTEFHRTDLMPINHEGVGYITIAGVEFRLVLFPPRDADFEVDYVQLKWKASDKRAIRGMFGPGR